MKRSLYFLPISIFSFVMMYYLMSDILSPYNSEGDLNISNISIILLLLFVTLFTLLSIIFTVIDKLFFKKFYQSPNYFKIMRISFILATEIVINIYLKVIGDWDIFVITISVLILIAIIVLSLISDKDEQKTLVHDY